MDLGLVVPFFQWAHLTSLAVLTWWRFLNRVCVFGPVRPCLWPPEQYLDIPEAHTVQIMWNVLSSWRECQQFILVKYVIMTCAFIVHSRWIFSCVWWQVCPRTFNCVWRRFSYWAFGRVWWRFCPRALIAGVHCDCYNHCNSQDSSHDMLCWRPTHVIWNQLWQYGKSHWIIVPADDLWHTSQLGDSYLPQSTSIWDQIKQSIQLAIPRAATGYTNTALQNYHSLVKS